MNGDPALRWRLFDIAICFWRGGEREEGGRSSGKMHGTPQKEGSYSDNYRGISLVAFAGMEGSNDWGERGYDNFVPGKVTKTAPSGGRTI